MSDKKPFLVVYDYGMGGIWCVVNARSAGEIRSKYPDLKVVPHRPQWMTDEHYPRPEMRFDIDDPRGWLAGE